MNASERHAKVRIDVIMSRYDAEERRALADLRALGFPVQSIAGARRLQQRENRNY